MCWYTILFNRGDLIVDTSIIQLIASQKLAFLSFDLYLTRSFGWKGIKKFFHLKIDCLMELF